MKSFKRIRTWLFLAILPIIALLAGRTPAAAQSQLPTWGTVPSPNAGSAPNELQAVAVISPTDIWAAGSFGDSPYPDAGVHHWDGSAWTLVDLPPGVGSAEILDITAVAADDVWFVGGRNQGGQALILRWNGASISIVPNPNPGTYNRLFGVAAVSANDVWAVGEYASGGVSTPLILRWNGANWAVVASPTSPGEHTGLNDVAVVSANDIWAVGDAGPRTFAVRWNGSQWLRYFTPNAGSGSTFRAVSALSATNVWAVGDGASGLLSARWDGTRWVPIKVPSPTGNFKDLNDVIALSANEVWAVGFYSDGAQWKALAVRWDGARWLRTAPVNPDPALNVLSGIDGSSGNLWAVGKAGPVVSGQSSLVQHWDGGAWQLVPGANGGIGSNALTGISAAAPDDIWAVGNVDGNSLTLHWDGSFWGVVPSPNLPFGAELNGVLAVSATDAWAVGTSGDPGSLDSSNVIMRWNGTQWAFVSAPNPGGVYVDELLAIDGISANDIWAVGEYWDAALVPRSAILHWDGSAWSNVANPCGRPLHGVTALAANNVWAVGDTISCHYNGQTWSVVAIAPPQGFEISLPLFDVSGSAPNDIWAVGAAISDYGQFLVWNAMAQRWNGSQWVRHSAPGQVLYGVEALAADDVWAVGTTGSAPLIAHFNGGSWSQVPTPPSSGGQLHGITSVAGGKLWAAGAYYTDDGSQRTLIMEAPSSTQGAVIGDTNVSGAVVSWFGPVNGSTQTNVFGDYVAAGLPAGDYFFVASFGGCTPATANVTVVAGMTIERNLFISC